MNQQVVWVVPQFAMVMLHKMFKGNNRGGGLGMQEINQIISLLSSNMIIALMLVVLPWVKVAGVSENGISIAEDSFLRIYLENFKGTRDNQGITGNLWSVLRLPKNENLISLTVYFLNLIVTMLTLRT